MLLEQVGLVRIHYGLKISLDAFEALVEIFTQSRDFRERVPAIVLDIYLKFAAHDAGFRFLADVIKALAQNFELKRIQFFCSNQHFLAYADFSEIVKQGRVADLLQLLGVKMSLGIGAGRSRVHGRSQTLG